MTDSVDTTTEKAVAIYEATSGIFSGLIKEVRELSRKKPDAAMSKAKVRLINRALVELDKILKDEPEGQFLDQLDEEDLPQYSDAVLVMVQYETAVAAFSSRYHRLVNVGLHEYERYWITDVFLSEWKEVNGQPPRFYGDRI